jgi:O-methyltransferase
MLMKSAKGAAKWLARRSLANSLLLPLRPAVRKAEAFVGFTAWSHKHLKNQKCWRPEGVSGYDHGRRKLLYQRVLESERLAGEELTYLEFGVFQGESIKWWLERNSNPDSRFHGFDTFEGLPERWEDKAAGTFSTFGQCPHVADPRCKFIQGMFQATLTEFLNQMRRNKRLIVHLDADLYTSTIYVLLNLSSYLRSGDILIFDEFNSVDNEFRAFEDFVAVTGARYRVIGFVNDCEQVAMCLDLAKSEGSIS